VFSQTWLLYFAVSKPDTTVGDKTQPSAHPQNKEIPTKENKLIHPKTGHLYNLHSYRSAPHERLSPY